MKELSRPAHAKINVFLRVLGRRDDGYHDIESLILPVSLRDHVLVREAETLSVSVAGERAADLKDAAAENLAIVAARALAGAAGVRSPGAEIVIDKRIPVAAGLGGGSSDAAASLRLLNELWSCGLTDAELGAVAASIGSDVPALLTGGASMIRGRGEEVVPVHVVPIAWTLAPLPFGVRTRDAYEWWDERPVTGPDAGALIAAAETGDHELLASAMFDDLQAPVAARHPQIDTMAKALRDAGALGVVMSGSGPTLAALARDLEHARELAAAVPGSIAVTFPPEPDPQAG